MELLETNPGDKTGFLKKSIKRNIFKNFLFHYFIFSPKKKLFQSRNTDTLRKLQKSNTSEHICLKLRLYGTNLSL
jgi:hypothetical protein